MKNLEELVVQKTLKSYQIKRSDENRILASTTTRLCTSKQKKWRVLHNDKIL